MHAPNDVSLLIVSHPTIFMQFVSRLNKYAKELGLDAISYAPLYRSKTAEYSSSSTVVNGKVIPVEEVDAWYLPDRVLGMTNLSKIWLKKGLGYFKKFVLYHEEEHIRDPHERNEELISKRAANRLGLAYSPI